MKLLYRIIFFVSFLAILGFVIAYARGYRLDLEKRVMTSTGILAVSSYPKAAKIYINKEGLPNFRRNVSLKGELVITLEPILFPINPALSPLTNLGIIKAVPI